MSGFSGGGSSDSSTIISELGTQISSSCGGGGSSAQYFYETNFYGEITTQEGVPFASLYSNDAMTELSKYPVGNVQAASSNQYGKLFYKTSNIIIDEISVDVLKKNIDQEEAPDNNAEVFVVLYQYSETSPDGGEETNYFLTGSDTYTTMNTIDSGGSFLFENITLTGSQTGIIFLKFKNYTEGTHPVMDPGETGRFNYYIKPSIKYHYSGSA